MYKLRIYRECKYNQLEKMTCEFAAVFSTDYKNWDFQYQMTNGLML